MTDLWFPLSYHSAIVWGSSAKHSRGQKVGLEHVLEDEDGQFLFFTSPFCKQRRTLLTPRFIPRPVVHIAKK